MVIYFAIFAIAVGTLSNTIAHMAMESIRPFDWVMLAVEVLVLALIAYEVWVGFHERRIKRLRERFLTGKRELLSEFSFEGESLRRKVPQHLGAESNGPEREWCDLADSWGKLTVESLEQISPKAAIAFNIVRDYGGPMTIARTPNSAGIPFMVGSPTCYVYQRLIGQLANLTEIMEKADFYF